MSSIVAGATLFDKFMIIKYYLIMKITKIGSYEKEIIKQLSKGAVLGLSLAVPNLPKTLQPFLKDRRKKNYYSKLINNLQEKEIIILGGERIELTEKGKELLKLIEIEDIVIKPKKNWDGIWHVVSYDIPENKKKEREYFRKRLLELGFTRVQESMFTLPYKCKNEIAVLAQTLGISPFVIYLNTDQLPEEKKFRKIYSLKKTA